MGADLSTDFGEYPVEPAVAPEPEPKPILNPYEAYIQQLERELEKYKAKEKQATAKLAKETLKWTKEIEALKRRHQAELELYASEAKDARRLSDAAATVDTNAQRLADERAMQLMQQRLNSVMEVDDATFEYISGPLGFKPADFPFASLKPGRLPGGTLVLRIQLEESFKGDEDVLLRFKKTLATMQVLNGGDGTLLRLIGASNLDSDDPIAYVEYVTGMTLRAYLMDKQDATWPEKLWIAVQIGKAIVHIHNLAVMHRDVSWSRVFVDATANVKVFTGLKVRQVEPTKNSHFTSGISEARWGAPETLPEPQGGENGELDSDSATTYTDKIDIFGLGLILISLVTRDVPFGYVLKTSGRRTPIDDDLVTTWLKKRETAIPMLTQSFDDDYACPSEEYKKLALECIQFDPELRPTAPEVVRRLEMIRQAYGGGGFTTPDLDKVDLMIAPVKTTGALHEPHFGTAYDVWCEINIDEASRKPVTTSVANGGASHKFAPQSTTLASIEPLVHTLVLLFKTSTVLRTKTIGKVTIPLMELLKLEGDEVSLTAVRTKKYPIVHEGDPVGVCEFKIMFGSRLRGYLELYERQTTEYLRNNEDGPSTLDLRKKRDVAAEALLSGAP
ncbi:TKL protein kinase [Saprolegnia parasitica CBS 223.65]|uniref:TKL protein kinase n=1 Tax=Saprolegnia parasitica (strain CBS 223.65) TaxID=695850 RepID=A0A067CGQ7_SAPPC|nr:TKL protein kinase [Saprolegnia parasitica CBS 223.65]KDO25696.1 TKL protein kinase [Saprolegnia parasitica CBS 223.65]|eukprot:XP_012203506.1 TKL protein kinase [Saprolegnia parasitica CBS 223.65]